MNISYFPLIWLESEKSKSMKCKQRHFHWNYSIFYSNVAAVCVCVWVSNLGVFFSLKRMVHLGIPRLVVQNDNEQALFGPQLGRFSRREINSGWQQEVDTGKFNYNFSCFDAIPLFSTYGDKNTANETSRLAYSTLAAMVTSFAVIFKPSIWLLFAVYLLKRKTFRFYHNSE